MLVPMYVPVQGCWKKRISFKNSTSYITCSIHIKNHSFLLGNISKTLILSIEMLSIAIAMGYKRRGRLMQLQYIVVEFSIFQPRCILPLCSLHWRCTCYLIYVNFILAYNI